ncbi:uncharacterized protein K02A2.6-like [Biomphalaria glabrata]|uniref:Uncharacterized protein K02A2.6-like n=1 Tax=Biomphalaria glabrata TaxID=6526 RepID=A0A9W3AJN1_BIOGL|nr:uncharacterized protein K02A2.6-like [Biomphalaria glabrata]
MDEILIAGRTIEEHDDRLRQVLDIARRKGIKLKPSKCSLRVRQVKFVGHIITDSGIKPDDSKIEAIQSMPYPTDRKELERFLGMINYLGKFLQNLSEITAPLRELLKQDNEWIWVEQHQKAVDYLKSLITTAPVLAFYDVSQPVKLSVDASREGLRAVLMQNERSVAYASSSLTDCEKRDAQIEKKMLAIVFRVERFHYYVYGRPIKVETDHKPLEAIIKKPLASTPPRLQRMLLRLMKYEILLEYKPGKEMSIPDTLSRASLPIKYPSSDDWDAQVHLIVNSLPMSDEYMNIFQQATADDAVLRLLKNNIMIGWPNKRAEITQEIRAYSGFKEELSESNGLLFKGERLIVPKVLQKEMLQRLHQGHLGRDRCLVTAKEVFFWPGMSKQIIDMVSTCAVCNEHQKSQQKEPLLPHDTAVLPWEKIGADNFEYLGKNYMLLVDYYSNFFEIHLIPTLKASDVIIHMKSQYARHGIPRELISDNGPSFACQEFLKFSKSWGFKHITSSPRFPQSNGMAERAIQTVKQLLNKARTSGQDTYMAILQFRNAPCPDGPSTARLLMDRRLRTNLPTTEAYLRPQIPDKKENAWKTRKSSQAKYYNKTARRTERPHIQPGSKVWMQKKPGDLWEPAVVISEAETPRSYWVKIPNGITYRRNRRMLRDTCTKSRAMPDIFEMDTPETVINGQTTQPENVSDTSVQQEQTNMHDA